jgi:hypothetical protein
MYFTLVQGGNTVLAIAFSSKTGVSEYFAPARGGMEFAMVGFCCMLPHLRCAATARRIPTPLELCW